jgi:hypothetical protein
MLVGQISQEANKGFEQLHLLVLSTNDPTLLIIENVY